MQIKYGGAMLSSWLLAQTQVDQVHLFLSE